MKQTNYFKSINFMKSFLLTSLLTLISISSFAQGVYTVPSTGQLNFASSNQTVITSGRDVLYTNVITINGQQIDCRVTCNGSLGTSSSFDLPFTSSGSDNAKLNNMFIPDFRTNSPIVFTFSFGVAQFSGSTFTNLEPLVLKNVVLNVYDIDGTASTIEQIVISSSDYSSFALYANPTTFNADDNSTSLTFEGDGVARNNSNSTYSDITTSSTRATVNFGETQSMVITLDPNISNSTPFYLDFSSGPLVTPTITSDNINSPFSIDLDKSNNNLHQYNVMSRNTSKSITDGTGNSKINITTNSVTNATIRSVDLIVSGMKDNINNGNSPSEYLTIATSTTPAIIPINRTNSNNTDISLGGNSYRVVSSATNSNRNRTTLQITRRSSNANQTMTLSQAEEVLDALSYINIASTPTSGVRIIESSIFLNSFNFGNNTFTNVTSPSGFFIADFGTILPVDLISFTGLAKTEGNQLNWTVAQEVDFSHYEVLRSTNGKDFAKIGEVYPENKSTEMKNYTFMDASV